MRAGRIGTVMVSAWLGLAGLCLGAEPGSEASRLSADDTVFYMEAPQTEALFDRVTSDRVVSLLKAIPGLEEKLRGDKKLRELEQVVRFVSTVLDTKPEDSLRAILGGRAVMAVEGQTKVERIYIVITPKDVEFLKRAHAKLLELARQDAAGKGKPDPVKEAEYRGVTGYSLSKTEAHAIVDDQLVIANGADALRTWVDRAQEPSKVSKPLSADAQWQARRAAQDPEMAVWALAKMDRLRVIKPDPNATKAPDAGGLFLLGPWIEALRKSDWITASVSWTDARLGANMTVNAPPGSIPAAMKGFRPSEKGQGAKSPLKPSGTIASVSLWRDMAAVWEARGEIFPPEAQQGFAKLDTFAGQFFGGRDFGHDVLGALGQDWRLVVLKQDAEKLNPRPDVILPGFALVVDLNGEDPEFSQRLLAAYQSFVGLANLNAAQSKAPPLMQGSEQFEGVTVSTARFLPPPKDAAVSDGPVPIRHNLSPAVAQVGNRFILSSTVETARALVTALKAKDQPAEARGDQTLRVVADGQALSALIDQNRAPLIDRIVVKEGKERDVAGDQVKLLEALAKYLGQGALSATDTADGVSFSVNFALDR